jgi:hypothetical protein
MYNMLSKENCILTFKGRSFYITLPALKTKLIVNFPAHCYFVLIFHTVDTVHLRHIKLSFRPTDAH